MIYLIHKFGSPNMSSNNIRELFNDENKFPKIHLYEEDRIMQQDKVNCGMFTIMAMFQLSLSTTHSIQKHTKLDQVTRYYDCDPMQDPHSLV
jgi:hypothetical protein